MKKRKYIWQIINKLQIKLNKNIIAIMFDIIACKLKYQASIMDYELFEMYNLDDFERKTIITKGKNNDFIKKYNTPKFFKYFHNRMEFNKLFNKYLNYNWLELNRNLEEFKTFCKENKNSVALSESLIEPKIQKINIEQENIEEIYNYCVEQGLYIVEEEKQISPTLKKLSEMSIVKVITLLGKVMISYLHLEADNKNEYPFSGYIAPIDIETGIISQAAVDKIGNTYLTNGKNIGTIKDMHIPNWDKVIKMCENASLEIPNIGYICWDIGIGKNKCYLLAGTGTPNHYFYN